SFDWKTAPDFLKTVGAHYVLVKKDEGNYTGPLTGLDPIPNEDSSRYGVTVAGDKMGVDYRANYEIYNGTRKSTAAAASQDVDANMMDAEVGYSMPSMMGFRVHGTYHVDTGTSSATKDQTYQGFYYDRHDNGGLMEKFAWGNLTYMNLGLTANPRDDISVAVNYYTFTKTEKKDFAYAGTGKTVGTGYGAVGTIAATNPANSTKSDLGTELDISVTKKYNNNFSINAHYAMFTPGDV